jgi:polar amino acid transport system substrate-binding protein
MSFTRRNLFIYSAALATAAGIAPVLGAGPSSLDRIKASGVLRVGVTSAEPWFFKDPLSGTWSGIGVAMGERLSADLGVKFEPVETTWATCIAGLQAGQIDIMFVLDPTPERSAAVDFPASPLFYYAMGALVADGSAIKSWSDIDQPGTRIGVTLGTSLDKNMTQMMKSAEISRFQNNDLAITAFLARRVDVVVQFHPALVVQYARLKLGKVILPTPVTPVMTSAGLGRDIDPAFKDWVSSEFAALYKDGAPDRLFTTYLTSKGIDPKGVPGLVKEAWTPA